jgi:hypothetical protein
MHKIERAIASIREDRRADYLFDTKLLAERLGIHPNKVGAQWYRTRHWLIEVCCAQPAETAAEFAAIFAIASKRRSESQRPPPGAKPSPNHKP